MLRFQRCRPFTRTRVLWVLCWTRGSPDELTCVGVVEEEQLDLLVDLLCVRVQGHRLRLVAHAPRGQGLPRRLPGLLPRG